MRKLVKVMGLVVCLFFMLAPLAIAQVDYCEGDFDYDRDQDGTDAFTFKADFGRSTLLDPCPADGPAPVGRTGQTTSYAIGDDGALEKGVSWPNPRFTDNGNGTVTDNLTGLIWLKYANCFGQRDWFQAVSDCNGLSSGSCGLTDGSVVGDWRLPNVNELISLVDRGQLIPPLPYGHPFTNVRSDPYWSSTTAADSTFFAWYVDMNLGDVFSVANGNVHYVWPVRGGH